VKIAEMGKLAGKEVNFVHYFLSPDIKTAAGAAAPDTNEPDDIPF
jgi:hypothetical protein